LQIASLNPFRLQFVAQSNVSYSVLFKTNVSGTPWFLLSNVAAQSQARTVLVTDPSPPTNGTSFYRTTTP